jgi:hypothetical protein
VLKSAEEARAAIAEARKVRSRSPDDGLNLLNEIFGAAQPPQNTIIGRLDGDLVALDIAPGVTQLLSRLTSNWLPWKGKTFDPTTQRGDNIFTRDSITLARIFNPFYRGFTDDGQDTYRAFAFRTYLGPGREDPDLTVMKIDYDLGENPNLTIRRVLDELVQIGEGTYLGKAHVKWWSGRWQRVAFFMLSEHKA